MDPLLRSYDIIREIMAQLPRRIADRVRVEVKSDPYHLRTRVLFVEVTGHKQPIEPIVHRWECELEPVQVGDRYLASRIPDDVLCRMMIEIKDVQQ